MKIIEHIAQAQNPLVSFEVIPPGRYQSFAKLKGVLNGLAKYDPPFIDVTSHASSPEGIKRSPGTLGICSYIQHTLKIDAVPHVLCYNFTREETEDFLIDMEYMEINNIFVVQGDKKMGEKPLLAGKSRNIYASDCLAQIEAMNQGIYLNGKGKSKDFGAGAVWYPEKHIGAPDLETSLYYTKLKVDRGAQYLLGQMCFDNEKFFVARDQLVKSGVRVPILPGVKIITKKRQLELLPNIFKCSIPQELYDEVMVAKDEHVPEIGIRWAVKQTQDYFNRGVPLVHYYVMMRLTGFNEVMKRL